MMSHGRSRMPDTWATSPLGDIAAKITKGSTPTTYGYDFQKQGINFIKIENVREGRIDTASILDFISEAAHRNQSRSNLSPDDVLFSIAGTIGEIAIVESMHLPANTNQAFAIISGYSKTLLPKFLEYQLRSFVADATRERARGGAMNNVSLGDLKELSAVIAPLPEQARIVGRIEELFSELNKGVESLKAAREQLKAYRQALLKHAFEGKLTAEWREKHADKLETADQLLDRIREEREARYQEQLAEWRQAVKDWEAGGNPGKKPSKPRPPKEPAKITPDELKDLPELPASWRFARLGDFIGDIDAGKSFTCDEREPGQQETGVAKVSAVTWGEYDESESKTCIDPVKVNSTYFIQPGDFLFSRANTIELVGACVIVQSTTKNVMLSDKTLRLHFESGNNVYFMQYLRSIFGRNEIMKRSTGNQHSMRNIGQDRIRSIIVPVCSELEMAEIKRALLDCFATVDTYDRAIGDELKRSEVLRQAILKRAFSGKLVPQDSMDEPASVLLERIKAEKERSAKNKRNRKDAAA